ncbi:hypothetical protein NRB20_09380 [Nocardia sp. RB20]|uniref:Uncharacterized protein n=1 Tax=Nocardia macrotermitis TaxID=2585198 RepID=A0A7K0CWS9_9NOCA|nr:hypothetical protein [Nocardia macrotermitis]
MSGQGRRRQRSVTTQAPDHARKGTGMSGQGRRRQRSVTTQAPDHARKDAA